MYPRKEVEQEIEKCRYAGVMSSGIEYYLFTDDDLTWVFTILSTYVHDWIEEGYDDYKEPERIEYMLIEFLDRIIAAIRKRKLQLTDYPIALEMLRTLSAFPTEYDDEGKIHNKATKIIHYLDL